MRSDLERSNRSFEVEVEVAEGVWEVACFGGVLDIDVNTCCSNAFDGLLRHQVRPRSNRLERNERSRSDLLGLQKAR